MATVLLPRSLGELFPDMTRHLDLDCDTIGAVIEQLDQRWPGMRDRLCEPGPRIRPFINIFVDGQRAGLDTPVMTASTVHVIPAVAGGCGPAPSVAGRVVSIERAAVSIERAAVSAALRVAPRPGFR